MALSTSKNNILSHIKVLSNVYQTKNFIEYDKDVIYITEPTMILEEKSEFGKLYS